MSTMEPEEMLGGRRMDGNSIWRELSVLLRDGEELGRDRVIATYQALVLGQKNRDTGVDLADC